MSNKKRKENQETIEKEESSPEVKLEENNEQIIKE